MTELIEIFGCDQCSKVFDTLGRYNQHLKTHTKPFQCSECVRSFALRSDLTRHVQTRHRLGVARHGCTIKGCSFKATRKDNIRQHLRNRHPKMAGSLKEPMARRSQSEVDSLSPTMPIVVPSNVQDDLPSAGAYTLMQAASTGNLGLVQTILQWGIDVSLQDDDGNTALHCAAKANQTEMIKLLLQLGAQSDLLSNKGRTPLHEAIVNHNASAFEILVDRRADITRPVLRATVEMRNDEFFQEAWTRCDKHLLKDFSYELFDTAANHTQTAIMATLLSAPEITQEWISEKGMQTVTRIITRNQATLLNCLLKSGKLDLRTDTGDGRWDPRGFMRLAAAKGHTETVSLLVEHGISIASYKGISPLGIAAIRGHLGVVQKLLTYPGVVVDNGWKSPLHMASRGGHVEVIRLMLKAFVDRGLDVDNLDNCKPRMTALQTAVFFGHVDAVRLLLARQDVDVNRRIHSRMTLCQVAVMRGHSKTLGVLLEDRRINWNDARNSRASLLFEAISGLHWRLLQVLLSYETVPLETIHRNLQVPKEPTSKPIDLLEKYLADIASSQPQVDSLWCGAAHKGNLALAMLLLEHAHTHGYPAHPSMDVNRKDAFGRTPLHVATRSRKSGFLELLLHHPNVDVNLVTKGRACGPGQSALEFLQDDMDHKDFPLEHEELSYEIDLLLAHGAQAAPRDRGENADSLAILPLSSDIDRQCDDSAEFTRYLEWKYEGPRTSVVGVYGGGVGARDTGAEVEDAMGHTTSTYTYDSMEEDHDAMFEELMYPDFEEMPDVISLDMLERRTFSVSPSELMVHPEELEGSYFDDAFP